MAFGWRSIVRTVGVVVASLPLSAAASGCASCDADGACMSEGIYVYAGDLEPGTTLTTCINDECRSSTLAADAPSSDLGPLVQDQRNLPDGEDVEVTIIATDPAAAEVGRLTERRDVPAGGSECACAVLIYEWSGDSIDRLRS
jgi:hypothetical protein